MRYKTKRSGIVFLILAILWSFVIWSFSAKSAASSTVDSDAAASAINSMLETFFGGEFDINTNLIRKLAHFCEFAVLGFFAFMAFYFLGYKEYTKLLAYPVIWGFSVAVTDEFLQLFFEGRSAQVTDVLLDVSGTLTSVLILLSITFFTTYGVSSFPPFAMAVSEVSCLITETLKR